jgi:aminoglycoside 3-N-acetyltransferase I
MNEPHVPLDSRESFIIRRLSEHDVGLMHQLLSVFADAFAEQETYGAARPCDHYMQTLLASDSFAAFVAVESGQVIGGLTAYILPMFQKERTEIYIYDLAVAASHRRRGIATSLIRELMEFGRRIGACVAFVQADRDDAPAIAMYERLGARADVFHFDFNVEP